MPMGVGRTKPGTILLWVVVGVYRSSNCRELARDIVSQLADLIAS